VTWICPLLKTVIFSVNEHLYFEGDEINSVYFIKKGEVGFVLPKHNNVKYININEGIEFGMIDICGCAVENDYDLEGFY